MEYRKDIDGLRAIAVLVVILFHYGFSLFPGGFIGVDIFFVISGYLITSIIVNDLEEEDFSFKKFYLRRARRILPALYTVLVISLLCAFIIFLPKDFLHFGKSLIATIVFVSNIMFMMDAGYFDTSALVKPLLHTWSLSVEEQFYLVFPVLLITLYKFLRSHFFNAILLLFFVTLALSEYVRDSNQIEAFFQSQSRAWEFLMGALLLHPKIRSLKK